MSVIDPPSDPPGFPTNARLRRLAYTSQVEAIFEWFYYNFEDPTEGTEFEGEASASFFHVWGGPYDASALVHDRFDGVATIAAVADAIASIASISLDGWAPAQRRLQLTSDGLPPRGTEAYWRHEIALRLRLLEQALEPAEPAEPAGMSRAGIGHNNPPAPIGDDRSVTLADVAEVRQAIEDVRAQLAAPSPDADQLASTSLKFRRVAGDIGMWLARKADTAVDEGIKYGVRAAVIGGAALALSGKAELQGVQDALHSAAHAIMQFVHLIRP